MSFESSWMSCRVPSTSSRAGKHDSSILPQFSVPSSAQQHFALETRPPSLPNRNSPLRLIGICVVFLLCTVGMVEILQSAAEPATRHGRVLLGGVSTAVTAALAHANDAADRRQQEHVEARQKFIAKIKGPRRLEQDDYEASLPDLNTEPPAGAVARIGSRTRSSLLLRIATLAKNMDAAAFDLELVKRLFPLWLNEGRDTLDTNAVLRDLVMSVSLLANEKALPDKKC